MGDPRRFHLFANFIAAQVPAHQRAQVRVADVAAGKGYLSLALREHGFRQITPFESYPRHGGQVRRGKCIDVGRSVAMNLEQAMNLIHDIIDEHEGDMELQAAFAVIDDAIVSLMSGRTASCIEYAMGLEGLEFAEYNASHIRRAATCVSCGNVGPERELHPVCNGCMQIFSDRRKTEPDLTEGL